MALLQKKKKRKKKKRKKKANLSPAYFAENANETTQQLKDNYLITT